MKFEFINKLANIMLCNRSGIMGVAIIWIFLLHSSIGQNYFGVNNYILDHGWVGVDIFFFLSSIGLCFSYSKNSLKEFWLHRIIRIIPTWLVVLLAIHIIGVIVVPLYPNFKFIYPQNLLEILCWYTGLGYWFNGCSYEWYVPSLLLFYILFPLLYKSSIRNLWVILLFVTFVTVSFYYSEFLFHIRLCYTRFIVFILGILFYKYLKKEQLYIFYIPILGFSLLMFTIHKYIGISDVFLYEFLTPILVFLIGWLLRIFKLASLFSFWGTLSLEFYLIHLYRRPQFFIGIFTDSVMLQHLFAFILCTIAAYILSKIMKIVNQNLYKLIS